MTDSDSGSGYSKTNVLLIFVTLAALGLGAVLATAPSALPPEVLEAVATVEETVDQRHVLIGAAAAIGLFGLWRSYFSGATDVRADTDPDAPAGPPAGSGGGSGTGTGAGTDDGGAGATVDVVGERTTERVERTIEALKRGNRANTNAVVADLRESLRAVETARGYASDAADERIRSGEWTDDRIAAVFLGDESAGRLPLGRRLRRWLFPGRTFQRRLEQTLEEMERYAAESEYGGSRIRETSSSSNTNADTDASSTTMNPDTHTRTGDESGMDSDGDSDWTTDDAERDGTEGNDA